LPFSSTTISIGSALRRANERFRTGSWADLKVYLDALESRPAVAEAARIHGPLEQPDHVDHHNEFVGNGPGAFFPQIDAQLKNDVMRAGIIQALRLALYRTFRADGTGDEPRERPLPVTHYWIRGAEAFEAYVDLSATEVHLFLVTPDPAPALGMPPEGDAKEEPMWVCASPLRVKELLDRTPNQTHRKPVSMPAGLSAVCQPIKNY